MAAVGSGLGFVGGGQVESDLGPASERLVQSESLSLGIDMKGTGRLLDFRSPAKLMGKRVTPAVLQSRRGTAPGGRQFSLSAEPGARLGPEGGWVAEELRAAFEGSFRHRPNEKVHPYRPKFTT